MTSSIRVLTRVLDFILKIHVLQGVTSMIFSAPYRVLLFLKNSYVIIHSGINRTFPNVFWSYLKFQLSLKIPDSLDKYGWKKFQSASHLSS